MKMERVMIQIPRGQKQKLDALRKEGYTTSGFIRAVLERELERFTPSSNTTPGRKGKTL